MRYVRSFLVPPHPHGGALAQAEAAVLEALTGYEALFLFRTDWRTFYVTSADEPPEGHWQATELYRLWLEALRQAGLFVSPPTSPPRYQGLLRRLPRRLAVLQVPLPLVSPETLVDLGQTMAEACLAYGPAAVVAEGYLGGPRAEPSARVLFSERVLALFRQGLGHQLANLEPDLWLSGHPHQDLSHLFLLLGSAGGTTAADVLAHADSAAGYAAVLAWNPDAAPPAKPGFIPLTPR